MLMMLCMNWMEKSSAVKGLQLNMQGPVLEVEEAEDVTQTVLVADVHEMTEEMLRL